MIAFSGLDGAGKSTQIDLLTSVYKTNNKKSIVFWCRGGYSPGMLYSKSFFIKKKTNAASSNRSEVISRNKQFSNPFVRKTWLFLSILDLIFFYGIYIRVKELLGTRIICDRYIFDTLIDFRLNFPQEQVDKWWIWKILCFLAVKPVKHFVLTVSVQESQKRSKLKDEPFPDSKETLEKRLKNYLGFVSINKFAVHIDGSNSIDFIHNLITKELY